VLESAAKRIPPQKDQNLKGSEFSIGIARGRMASGDWGVSYVRRTYVDTDIDGYRSPGCQGAASV